METSEYFEVDLPSEADVDDESPSGIRVISARAFGLQAEETRRKVRNTNGPSSPEHEDDWIKLSADPFGRKVFEAEFEVSEVA